jgi:hypothetical protein
MPLRKFGLYCGIISPILWLALIATAGALRPDFSHVTQYISELAERGSATEALMRYGAFGLTGLLYLCFAGALLATFRNGWLSRAAALLIALDGVGRMGAGAFPCDPGCVQVSLGPDLHKLFATIGFSSGILPAFGPVRTFGNRGSFSLAASVCHSSGVGRERDPWRNGLSPHGWRGHEPPRLKPGRELLPNPRRPAPARREGRAAGGLLAREIAQSSAP